MKGDGSLDNDTGRVPRIVIDGALRPWGEAVKLLTAKPIIVISIERKIASSEYEIIKYEKGSEIRRETASTTTKLDWAPHLDDILPYVQHYPIWITMPIQTWHDAVALKPRHTSIKQHDTRILARYPLFQFGITGRVYGVVRVGVFETTAIYNIKTLEGVKIDPSEMDAMREILNSNNVAIDTQLGYFFHQFNMRMDIKNCDGKTMALSAPESHRIR